MTDVASRVARLIHEYQGVSLDRITSDAEIGDDLGLDSLDKVELVMLCEEEFEVEISDDDASRIETVGDCVDLVTRKLQAKAF